MTTGSHNIDAVRAQIEAVDDRLLCALAERVALARDAGRLKRAAGEPVTDPAREAAVVARASARARDFGLPDDEVRALYWRLMAMSRTLQMDDRSMPRE